MNWLTWLPDIYRDAMRYRYLRSVAVSGVDFPEEQWPDPANADDFDRIIDRNLERTQ